MNRGGVIDPGEAPHRGTAGIDTPEQYEAFVRRFHATR
jgi:hypothetical protein